MSDEASPSRYAAYLKALREREASHRLRRVQEATPDARDPAMVWVDGRRLINACSNDYLNLSVHPEVRHAVADVAMADGAGSTASRLVLGTRPLHLRFEEAFAEFCGRDAALLFASGYQANVAALSALAQRGDEIYIDRLAHNSLLQGARLSQAKLIRFAHNDLDDLRRRLSESTSERRFVVTESVFSMDGDVPDLPELATLCQEHDAFLYVDEAHSIGVNGSEGRGICHGLPRVDLVGGMFGKAFGGMGGSVSGSDVLIRYLTNTAGGFIYSTAPSPPVVAGLLAALRLLPQLEGERARLRAMGDRLRYGLRDLGFDTLSSRSQIIPVLIGSEQAALDASRHLHEHGVYASAIRPPTVPEGASRIRLTLTAAHDEGHLDAILRAFSTWKGRA